MHARRAPVLLTALLATCALTGCAGDPPRSDPAGVDGLTVPTPSPDPADFVAGVDNPWFPLEPGTVRTYRSVGDEAEETVTVTVTDQTRVVQGVTTVVVHDVATDASGEVLEDTYDWFAQDADGNVWYFGEDTTAYDADGRPDTQGSWEAGVDGAEAGLVMPATPRVGDGYQQEYRPGVAEDRAQVLSLAEQREVPAGTFADLVETEDTTPLEPGLVERKYYAEGLGVVYEETVTGGTERLELVEVTQP
jgi:hypothetical protein